MWMMSVPIAMCTVTGICSRAAAASTLCLAYCGSFAARNRVTDWPMPRPAATPSLIAPLSSRPVSSAMPKRPGPSASSTSSDVAPASATSKSWMIDAPLVAMAETKPRSMRSISTGPSPVLITCAPNPHTTPPSARFASPIAATIALKSAAASMEGSESRKPPIDAPGVAGRAKSATRALLARDFNGYVLTSDRSNSSYVKITNSPTHQFTNSPIHQFTNLRYQHRVAVAVEPVPLRDRRIICGTDAIAARERRDQHQQRRLRQVKVRQQPADHAKLRARIQEEIGIAGARDDGPVSGSRHCLQRPRRRGADRDDTAAVGAGARHRRGRGRRDLIPFALEPMVLDAIDTDRLEGAVTDMQRDLGDLDPACGQCGGQLRREVQARGRRGDRSARLREHGLVPIAIVDGVVPLDVGRQRHVADGVDRLVQRRSVLGPQANHAAPKPAPLEDLAPNGVNSFKDHPRPRFQFLPRMHQRLPQLNGLAKTRIRYRPGTDLVRIRHRPGTDLVRIRHRPGTDLVRIRHRPGTDRVLIRIGQGFHQQAFDRAAAGIAAAEQARGEDSGVVDDDQIAGAEELGQRADLRMRDRTGLAVEVQQARAAARRRRLLRDQFRRKVEVEVADIHARC